MQVLTKWLKKAFAWLRLLGNPRLLGLKMKGVDTGWYLRLSRPWVLSYDVRTVIDIGANVGSFTRAVHEVFPSAKIYSFEPLPDCFEVLAASMREAVNFAPYNLAVGDTEGVIEFHRSRFTPASSPRMMSDLHRQLFPFTVELAKVQVPVSRLDTVFEDIVIQEDCLIKVDVQGYEDKVLSGGEHTFAKARIVIVEMAFQNLYEGQPSFDQTYQQLRALGFEYKGSLEQFISTTDGSVVYADCIFVKRAAL